MLQDFKIFILVVAVVHIGPMASGSFKRCNYNFLILSLKLLG